VITPHSQNKAGRLTSFIRYFRPKHIPRVGWFQDGGIWRNNPVGTALCEVRAIWPSIEEPDFVVSLGTGYQRQPTSSPCTSGPRGILRDGFIPRSYRAFMSSLSGRKLWQEFRNCGRGDTEGRYFRFDIEFDGREPSLDNINQMEGLKLRAQAEHSKSKELDNLARCVVASLFYFEFESTPQYEDGEISCAGHILCRLRSGDPALEVVLLQLSKSSAKFALQNHTLPGVIGDCSFSDRYGNFRKRVEFTVNSRQQRIPIHLREGSSLSNNISGSPFSVDSFVAAQGLEAHFGRADHRKRKQPEGLQCSGRKKQRVG